MAHKALPTWTKYAVAAAVVAVAIVIVRSMRERADEAAWAVLAEPEVQQGSVEALEDARERVRGTDAEAPVTYLLAHRLYELGGEQNFERARQVAREALEAQPDHPMAGDFRALLDAIDSFRTAPAAQA